ncbi:MAG: transporter, family, cyanate transporter [Actinomycetota bacterium]|nr:transporter, family, cyanate transporter [Actinomycetota bacterium]
MPSSTTGRDGADGVALPVPARLLVLAIFLVALNLRAALASLPPLVHTIQADLGLSSATAGLLTTLPVLCMGLFAPVSQRLAHTIGREATVGVAVGLLLAGLLLRLAASVLPVLFLTTLLAGIGIALCGTVLPGIVKEFFANRPGIVTGVYLVAMMVGATAASALAVPLAEALGSWQRSLASWSVLAVVALVAWVPVMRAVNDHAEPAEPGVMRAALPWRSRTAWLLAAYLALQSFGFYSQLAWISPSYEDRGWSAADAGLLLAVWSIVQLVSGLGAPVLADRFRDRRPLVAASVGVGLAGLLGVILAPDAAPILWIALMGLGQGGGFSLGLVKLVDYAPTPAASARLSALAFLISYSTASLGPLLFGALHDVTDSFTLPYTVLAGVLVVQLTLVPRLRPGRLTEPVAEVVH